MGLVNLFPLSPSYSSSGSLRQGINRGGSLTGKLNRLALVMTLFFSVLFFFPMSSFAASAPGVRLKLSYSLEMVREPAVEEVPPIDSPDLWIRIRKGFKLTDTSPRLTKAHEQQFVKNPGNIPKIIQRGRPYLFHIVEELESRGMPMEIALLPVIESAFNPVALSPMQAAGIWQFIPSTGKFYGLEQTAWYDGRQDILAATTAALNYLQKLHAQFGDWNLALAAYNCGEGCVARALSRTRNSRTLSLPKETLNYVPKLLAIRNIVLDPQRYGVELGDLPDEPYFSKITLKHPMEAHLAAELAGMDMAEFLLLNPAFKRRVIYTNAQNSLLIPIDKVDLFKHNEEKRKTGYLQHYVAQKGETAAYLSTKFGVTQSWLTRVNPVKFLRGKVPKTQILVVPKSANGGGTPFKH